MCGFPPKFTDIVAHLHVFVSRDRRQILQRNAARRSQRRSLENTTAVHHHKRADGVNISPEMSTDDLAPVVRHVRFIPCHASRSADHIDLIAGLFNSDENHSVLSTFADNTDDRSEDNRSYERNVRPRGRELRSQTSASLGDFRSTLIGSRAITLLPARHRQHGSSSRDIWPGADCQYSNRVRDISASASGKHRSSTVPDLPSASLDISCGPRRELMEVSHVVYSPRRHSYAEAVDSLV